MGARVGLDMSWARVVASVLVCGATLVVSACAASAPALSADHPADPAAPAGRLAGPPAILRAARPAATPPAPASADPAAPAHEHAPATPSGDAAEHDHAH